jgi:signal transduction histidine kinase
VHRLISSLRTVPAFLSARDGYEAMFRIAPIIAMVGLPAHLFFYYILEHVLYLRESLPLRLAFMASCVPLLFMKPSAKPSLYKIVYFEFFAALHLFGFSMLAVMNQSNDYWIASMCWVAMAYGLMTGKFLIVLVFSPLLVLAGAATAIELFYPATDPVQPGVSLALVAWISAIMANLLRQGMMAMYRASQQLAEEKVRSLRLEHAVIDAREQYRRRVLLEHKGRMETLGLLAGGLAHDLRNIMNILMGDALVLQRSGVPPAAQQRVKRIIHTIRRTSSLTQNLLGFAGRSRNAIQPVDVHELLDETLSAIATSKPDSIRITRELAAEQCIVAADPGLLQNALVNIVLNATQALEKTGGTVAIATRSGDYHQFLNHYSRLEDSGIRRGGLFHVQVADTGPGMDQETLKNIFEPLYSSKRTSGGVGLGLTMVLATIKAHQGAIYIESEPGDGTTVNVFLPVRESG